MPDKIYDCETVSLAEHDGVRVTQQRESVHGDDELFRQQCRQQRAAHRVRVVPADCHVSISAPRHGLLLRGCDASALDQR